MPEYVSNELAGTTTGLTTPANVASGHKPNAHRIGARVKAFAATVTYASQGTSDPIRLFTLPAGVIPLFMICTTSVSTSSTAISVGSRTQATKYATGQAYTTAGIQNMMPMPAAATNTQVASVVEEDVMLTQSGFLPASGTLNITMFVATPT